MGRACWSQLPCAPAEADADRITSQHGPWLTAAQIILSDRRASGGATVERRCRERQPADPVAMRIVDVPWASG